MYLHAEYFPRAIYTFVVVRHETKSTGCWDSLLNWPVTG